MSNKRMWYYLTRLLMCLLQTCIPSFWYLVSVLILKHIPAKSSYTTLPRASSYGGWRRHENRLHRMSKYAMHMPRCRISFEIVVLEYGAKKPRAVHLARSCLTVRNEVATCRLLECRFHGRRQLKWHFPTFYSWWMHSLTILRSMLTAHLAVRHFQYEIWCEDVTICFDTWS